MAENAKTQDERLLALIATLNAKKAEVANAERPTYITAGQFRYSEDYGNVVDVTTVRDERKLVSVLVFLKERSEKYTDACDELGVDNTFTWLGFSVEEWTEDLKTRMNVIQIGKRKAELKELEERVNKVMSPELRRELELKALETELTK